MAAKHTPELWAKEPWCRHEGTFGIYDADGVPLGKWTSMDLTRASGDRAIACVNALTGLNPEVVADMVKALEFVVEEGREVCSVMAAAVLTKARR